MWCYVHALQGVACGETAAAWRDLLNETSSDVERRMEDFSKGLDAHRTCNELLVGHNYLPQSKFDDAIIQCFDEKLVSAKERKELKRANRLANKAKHHLWHRRYK